VGASFFAPDLMVEPAVFAAQPVQSDVIHSMGSSTGRRASRRRVRELGNSSQDP
jgi:hypothetical protein